MSHCLDISYHLKRNHQNHITLQRTQILLGELATPVKWSPNFTGQADTPQYHLPELRGTAYGGIFDRHGQTKPLLGI